MARIELSNIGGGVTTLSLTTTGTSGASTLAGSVLNIPVYQSALTNPVTGTGTATRVAFWDSASSVSSSSDLYWDSSNSRLGVGNSSPGARLQVNGSGLTSGTTALSVKDSGGTDNFTVADNGATFVRGVLTVSGSSASNATTLMGRTVSGEVASISVGSGLTLSGNTLTVSGGSGITSLNGLTASTQTFATGTAGNDFNISSATSTHTFNLPTASATNRGALSNTDWTTFNSKVGGSGTATRVAFWSAGSTLSSSANLYWDNTNNRLGIGTTSPSSNFSISGTGSSVNAMFDVYASAASGLNKYFSVSNARGGSFELSEGTSASGSSLPSLYLQSNGVNSFGGVIYFGVPVSNDVFDGTRGVATISTYAGTFSSSSDIANSNIFLVRNRAIPCISVSAGGNLLVSNQTTASSARLHVRGSSAAGGTNALLVQNSTPSTLFQIQNDGATTLNGTLAQNGTVTMSDGSNIAVGSTNGTKIGTATTQKIGFYNKTPVVRPDTGVAEAAFVEGTGTAVNDNSTFGGYTIQQVVQALQNLGLLA